MSSIVIAMLVPIFICVFSFVRNTLKGSYEQGDMWLAVATGVFLGAVLGGQITAIILLGRWAAN